MSTTRIKGTTTVAVDKSIYTWTIKNYSLMKAEIGEKISSEKFCVGKDNKKYFNLDLYPEGDRAETKGFIVVFLCYNGSDTKIKPEKLICRFKLSAFNNEKVVHQSLIIQDFAKTQSWGLKFFDLKNIDKLISSMDTVTFQCELDIFNEYINNENEVDDKTEDVNYYKKKFNLSFPCEELSDVELITSDENTIPAHKFVLSMVSPVFRAMFTHDMMETKNNTIEITDTTHNILVEMLRYIYTGEIQINETDMILQLLVVADKYQIDSLIIECGKLLCDKLSTGNAIDFLISADKYNVKNLENKVLKFVTANTQLLDSEQLKLADPAVLLKITHSLRSALIEQKKP